LFVGREGGGDGLGGGGWWGGWGRGGWGGCVFFFFFFWNTRKFYRTDLEATKASFMDKEDDIERLGGVMRWCESAAAAVTSTRASIDFSFFFFPFILRPHV